MNKHEQMILDIIFLICNANSSKDALELYHKFLPLIIDYKFVFAAKEGGTPGFAVNKTFSAGGAIRSAFNTERIWVLDPDTVKDMGAGEATYPIDYSIALDTQSLSYLEPYISNKSSASLPSDFKEVFEFLACDEVNIDPLPYCYENLKNLKDGIKTDKIYNSLKAYEVLRTLDTDRLKTHSEVRSKLQEHELSKRAQEHISRLYIDLKDHVAMSGLNFRHQLMYALLLKMAFLQLKYPSSEVSVRDKKMAAFLEFCDSQLAIMSLRETLVAHAFFEQGQKLLFFKKIQKNREDLKFSLSNMAWDFLHVRHLEEGLRLKPSKNTRYFFSALLTFDKDFIKIIDLCPLKSCAFNINGSGLFPFYDCNWEQLVLIQKEQRSTLLEKYFTDEAKLSRNERYNSSKKKLDEIIEGLEYELKSISGVG